MNEVLNIVLPDVISNSVKNWKTPAKKHSPSRQSILNCYLRKKLNRGCKTSDILEYDEETLPDEELNVLVKEFKRKLTVAAKNGGYLKPGTEKEGSVVLPEIHHNDTQWSQQSYMAIK